MLLSKTYVITCFTVGATTTKTRKRKEGRSRNSLKYPSPTGKSLKIIHMQPNKHIHKFDAGMAMLACECECECECVCVCVYCCCCYVKLWNGSMTVEQIMHVLTGKWVTMSFSKFNVLQLEMINVLFGRKCQIYAMRAYAVITNI